MNNEFKVIKTTDKDLALVLELFEKVNKQKDKEGYILWGDNMDKSVIENDIDTGCHYKIVKNQDVLCVFAVHYHDPLIWREKDHNDAIYLHRIVVNTDFKGQKQFAKVLDWAIDNALKSNIRYIRMDTWAANKQLADYYVSFGFEIVNYYRTPNDIQIPVQYRDLDVVLFQMEVDSYTAMKKLNRI